MNILVIDIGGTNVKVWQPDGTRKVKFPSGPGLTPQRLVEQVHVLTSPEDYDRVSIGYPGDVLHERPAKEPYNLGPGWVGFDFAAEFSRPLRMMNDACMQALGGYAGGRMLYLGLGTSLGTTYIIDGKIVPLALGHLSFLDGTFDSCLNRRALEKQGGKRWRRRVAEAAASLRAAFLVDYVVLGGGNSKKLRNIAEGCRRGGNENAYLGGVRMWEEALEAVYVSESPA